MTLCETCRAQEKGGGRERGGGGGGQKEPEKVKRKGGQRREKRKMRGRVRRVRMEIGRAEGRIWKEGGGTEIVTVSTDLAEAKVKVSKRGGAFSQGSGVLLLVVRECCVDDQVSIHYGNEMRATAGGSQARQQDLTHICLAAVLVTGR